MTMLSGPIPPVRSRATAMMKLMVPMILAVGLAGLAIMFCFRNGLLYRIGISSEAGREYFDLKKQSDGFSPVLADPSVDWRQTFAQPSAGHRNGWQDWTLVLIVGVLGTVFAMILSQRAAAPAQACWFAVGIMWLAYLAPPILLEPFYRFGVFPYRATGIPLALFVAIQLTVLFLPWLFFGRSDPQITLPVSAFGSLTFYSLPWGIFSRMALTVRHEGEQAWPEKGLGQQMGALVDGVIWVSASKGDADIRLWRCGRDLDVRMLLLVERRIGFLRKVWCMVEVHQLGSDVSIKLHALTPRHLDYRDYTLLRYLLFPLDIVGGLKHVDNRLEGGPGAAEHLPRSALVLGVLSVLSLVVLAGLAWMGEVSTGKEVVGVGLALISFCIWVGLLLRATESIPATPGVARAAGELLQLTQQAVAEAVKPMRRFTR